MTPRRGRTVAAALGVVLLVAVVAFGIFWFGGDWKALVGWRALVDYVNPKNATGRKDAIQVYALIVAGVVATITAGIGLANLWLTRRNLKQQRELEAQRAQGTALQAYYQQIGNLITKDELRNTEREDIRELARGQTLTVLKEVDGNGKGSLLTFLRGAGLIRTENPAVVLTGADLRRVALGGANLTGVGLREANLYGAYLQGASLWSANLYDANLQRADLRKTILEEAVLEKAYLQRADLREANLQGANLQGANLRGANLRGAIVTYGQLDAAGSLLGAIMPDGSKHP